MENLIDMLADGPDSEIQGEMDRQEILSGNPNSICWESPAQE